MDIAARKENARRLSPLEDTRVLVESREGLVVHGLAGSEPLHAGHEDTNPDDIGLAH